MALGYKKMLDLGQQLSAQIDLALEKDPEDKELKELRIFLANRCVVLEFLYGAP